MNLEELRGFFTHQQRLQHNLMSMGCYFTKPKKAQIYGNYLELREEQIGLANDILSMKDIDSKVMNQKIDLYKSNYQKQLDLVHQFKENNLICIIPVLQEALIPLPADLYLKEARRTQSPLEQLNIFAKPADELVSSDEESKREKNRMAVRAYRLRKQNEFRSLNAQVQSLSEENQSLSEENQSLKMKLEVKELELSEALAQNNQLVQQLQAHKRLKSASEVSSASETSFPAFF